MSVDDSERARLRPGEAVLFIDRKEREYLRVLRPGSRLHIRDGTMQADHLMGLLEGSTVYNSASEPFLMVRPTFASLVPNLPRRAQVIYPKDIGPILLWGDIGPGMRVVEVGAGPGAMTMALLRAVGQSGEVFSYEARSDFFEMAQSNVRQFFGEAPNWHLKLADATAGIAERGVDRMVIDLAEPWVLLAEAAAALRPGGVLIAYVPTVLQLKQFVDQARARSFGAVQTMETFFRSWHVRGLSVRPQHRMIAHTGFIITGRRLAGDPPPSVTEPAEEEGEDDEAAR